MHTGDCIHEGCRCGKSWVQPLFEKIYSRNCFTNLGLEDRNLRYHIPSSTDNILAGMCTPCSNFPGTTAGKSRRWDVVSGNHLQSCSSPALLYIRVLYQPFDLVSAGIHTCYWLIPFTLISSMLTGFNISANHSARQNFFRSSGASRHESGQDWTDRNVQCQCVGQSCVKPNST
jgi:hypothetical protein